ncbi:hypothetical protein HMPREF1868_00252 [Olsenella sp. DNF00959]|nr:hypothetical protein HMPREF1868_00252 [Olsenella sp. DNF00959]
MIETIPYGRGGWNQAAFACLGVVQGHSQLVRHASLHASPFDGNYW